MECNQGRPLEPALPTTEVRVPTAGRKCLGIRLDDSAIRVHDLPFATDVLDPTFLAYAPAPNGRLYLR